MARCSSFSILNSNKIFVRFLGQSGIWKRQKWHFDQSKSRTSKKLDGDLLLPNLIIIFHNSSLKTMPTIPCLDIFIFSSKANLIKVIYSIIVLSFLPESIHIISLFFCLLEKTQKLWKEVIMSKFFRNFETRNSDSDWSYIFES
jgi:hypothetical protein